MINLTVAHGIATLTIDRPERRNAVDTMTAEALYEAWGRIDGDPEIKVTVLTSTDCGTFSAGMDLKEASEIRRTRNVDVLSMLRDPFMERMGAVRKPVIAAMTGDFAGAGMLMAVLADLRVGLAGTTGGIPEAQRGRGSPWAVPMLWMVPQALFMEMVLTGEMMPIEHLHRLGFVNYVEATPDAVRVRAARIANRIRDNAPLSVEAGKASIRAAAALGRDAGLAEAKRLHEAVYDSLDAEEGPRAFAEKRAPVWRGR